MKERRIDGIKKDREAKSAQRQKKDSSITVPADTTDSATHKKNTDSPVAEQPTHKDRMIDASRREFFVSFNQNDRAWATWIAWTLEEAGHSVFFQDWDFRGSFIEQMHQATQRSARTLIVLSDHYLHSEYARSEAWAALVRDPVGCEDRVVTIKVGPTTENLGLLGHFGYLDITTSAESKAERLLLERARKAVEPDYRPKPSTRPDFPGAVKRKVLEKPSFPVPIHNLPPHNPNFVGRENALAEIRKTLTKSAPGEATQVYAITGLGGVGKTETALAYTYRHLADYHLIWWLRASKETLATDYTTLADSLDLPEEREQKKAVQAVKAKLQATPDWLLVFDNVEEPAKVRSDYLPGTSGHVLLTSRRTDWQGIATQSELGDMSEPEALQLLVGRPGPETLPISELVEAKALAKELGFLPLALAQARAYMAETGKSLVHYRKLFEASRPAVLERGRASLGYPTSVAKTWQISIEAAEDECTAAKPLLELLAFFAPDPLPEEVLTSAPVTLPEGLGDELKRDDAIGALNRFSLLRAKAGAITTHRLVQAVTRDGLEATTAKARAAASLRLIHAALPRSEDPKNWPATTALLPHALATAEAAEHLETDLETVAKVLDRIALYQKARGAYAEAEPLHKRALAIREKALGPEHPDVAESLNNLAGLYWSTSHFNEAEPLHKRALAIREKALGPEHPDVAESLNNLAILYRDTVRYAEAEPLYQRALAIREKALGPEHPDVALSLNSLAILYSYQDRFKEAEPLYQRALAIREKALGPEHPDVALSLSNLAGLYWATNHFAEAEPLYQRALAIREKIHPSDDPHKIRIRRNYARLLDKLGRHAEAAELRAQATAIR